MLPQCIHKGRSFFRHVIPDALAVPPFRVRTPPAASNLLNAGSQFPLFALCRFAESAKFRRVRQHRILADCGDCWRTLEFKHPRTAKAIWPTYDSCLFRAFDSAPRYPPLPGCLLNIGISLVGRGPSPRYSRRNSTASSRAESLPLESGARMSDCVSGSAQW